MKKTALLVGFLFLVHGANAQTNTPPATAPAFGDAEKKQLEDLVRGQPIAAWRCVFVGDKFPAIDFVAKDLVRRAVGNYQLTVRYFSADWQEVTQPVAEGRYGAYVTVQFENGVSDFRHLTLYRAGKDYSVAKDPYRATLQFPKAFSLPPRLSESESWNVDRYINMGIVDSSGEGDDPALFLAALHDIATNPDRFRGYECLRIDNMWWQEWDKRQGLDVPYQKIVRVPDGYDQAPDKKWPLIIFLHGSGDGYDVDKLRREGPTGYADSGHPLPFIIVTPQCTRHERWNPDLIVKLVDDLEKNYRVDPTRIYLTGLSMGGSGILATAAAYPGKFAALAPLSGRENPGIAPRLHRIPAWFFHGEEDDLNPARFTVELVDALKAEKAPVKLTLLPGVGHGGWDQVYANPDLYTWFLQQHL